MTKLTPEQAATLSEEAAKEVAKSKGSLRLGQALMNVLYRLHPEIYKEVAANDKIDPFYVDAHIPEFWKFVS